MSIRRFFPLLLALALALVAAPAVEARRKQPAEVTVAVQPEVPAGLGPSSLAVPVVVTNLGPGRAVKIVLNVRLNPVAGRLIDAQFSAPGAWVSALGESALEARVEALDPNATLTMTLRYQQRPGAGALITDRVAFTWEDDLRFNTGTSNAPVPPQPQPAAPAQPGEGQAPVPLSVTRLATSNSLLFTGRIFAPGEPVALWLNTPGGGVQPLVVLDNRELLLSPEQAGRERPRARISTTATAGGLGSIALTLDPAGLPAGDYTLVARGLVSNLTATASFQR
jgi:hypothetical protein